MSIKSEQNSSEKNNRAIIAFATDDNFVYYTGVTVYSMLQHISVEHEYHIIIMSSNLNQEYLKIFEILTSSYPNVSFECLDMKKWIAKIGEENFYTGAYAIANYYRLFLCNILTEEDKALYLDSDIIVQDDIFKLWQTDMKNYTIAAALDKSAISPIFSDEALRLKKLCKKLHLKKPDNYFNSGVLLMDLRKLRDMNFSDIVKNEVMTGIQFDLVDQDILNRIFENNYLRLDKSWNHQPLKRGETYQNDHILHISGLRPWESRNKPYADIWWNIAEKTPFFDDLLKQNKEVHLKYLEQLELKYFDMFNTTCWKITKPIRVLASFFK